MRTFLTDHARKVSAHPTSDTCCFDFTCFYISLSFVADIFSGFKMKDLSSSMSLVRLGSSMSSTSANTPGERVVLVRYFLDRPGYDLSNSSSRLWVNPPIHTTPQDISKFLHEQGIKLSNETKMLVELYLDHYEAFMLLEACAEHSIYFDFSSVTAAQAGVLNIRLTDLNGIMASTKGIKRSSPVPRCNTSPVGLFGFSMVVGLDSFNILRELLDDSSVIDGSYLLVFSLYAFWMGFLLFNVGLSEISRNNVYGATAFLAFGCVWLANGTFFILTTYFPEQIPEVIFSSTSNNSPDTFLRVILIMLFACALLKQTFVMKKITTAFIGTLIVYLFFASLVGWSEVFLWLKMIFGFILCAFAFFIFYAELTNEVYQRTVINLYPWTPHSAEEAFGAVGRANGLRAMAIDLRTAGHHDILTSSMMTKGPAAGETDHPSTDHPPSAYHLRGVRPQK
jgi:succinate-acetate transporter protein